MIVKYPTVLIVADPPIISNDLCLNDSYCATIGYNTINTYIIIIIHILPHYNGVGGCSIPIVPCICVVM